MEKKYYYISFEDCTDDAFGGSHKFINNTMTCTTDFDHEYMMGRAISTLEVQKEMYDEWNTQFEF